MKWIPIKSRPADEEELKDIAERLGIELEDLQDDERDIYVSPLPEDDEEVLVCTSYGHVYIDTFYVEDEGCYFEINGEMDGIVAWMPLPEPYKEGLL